MVGFILVDESGSNRIVIAPGALAQLRAEHVRAVAADIEAADVVLVGLEIPVAPQPRRFGSPRMPAWSRCSTRLRRRGSRPRCC